MRVVHADSTRHPDRERRRALTLWRVGSRLTAARSTNHGIPPPTPPRTGLPTFRFQDLLISPLRSLRAFLCSRASLVSCALSLLCGSRQSLVIRKFPSCGVGEDFLPRARIRVETRPPINPSLRAATYGSVRRARGRRGGLTTLKRD